jgi:hypothetical protein
LACARRSLTSTNLAAAPTTPRSAFTARRRLGCADDSGSVAHIGDVGETPDTLFAWNSAQVDCSIRQSRSGLVQKRIRRTPAPATSFATGLSGGIALGLLLSCRESDDGSRNYKYRSTRQDEKPKAKTVSHAKASLVLINGFL